MTTCTFAYNPDTHSIRQSSSISFATPSTLTQAHLDAYPRFAFARVKGDTCLVQLVHPVLSETPQKSIPILVFRHEFVSIFRYSHDLHVSPEDIRILELLDEDRIRYEEDNGTVFLAKDLMTRLRRIIDASNLIRTRRSRLITNAPRTKLAH